MTGASVAADSASQGQVAMFLPQRHTAFLGVSRNEGIPKMVGL